MTKKEFIQRVLSLQDEELDHRAVYSALLQLRREAPEYIDNDFVEFFDIIQNSVKVNPAATSIMFRGIIDIKHPPKGFVTGEMCINQEDGKLYVYDSILGFKLVE